MDVIAGYKTGGSINGGIYIDGCSKDEKLWKKISGYAEQNDILNPYLTTLETVRFTAECRLPKTKNKQMIIDRILTLMNLEQWKDVIVGREVDGEGLPKHARKRLTIAIQLVIEPKILFLVREGTNYFRCFGAVIQLSDKLSCVRRTNQPLGSAKQQQDWSLTRCLMLLGQWD
jgi:ABC-type taurine transport system ATPase subunit